MNKERLLYCALVSLVMIPVMIFSAVGFVHTYSSYNSILIEKEFTYLGSNNPSTKYGLYLSVVDSSGYEKEVILSTNEFGSVWDFLDEVKVGEKIYISFAQSDTQESYVAGLRTNKKVYYNEEINKQEEIATMILYAGFAFISLLIEVIFIIVSKRIFRKKALIIKRTDRPATEDMFKESFFE